MINAVVERCAGIDVPKKTLDVCRMTGAADKEPEIELRLFGTFHVELEKLTGWLVKAGCTHAVVESKGSYWKPVYAVLEEIGIQVILANGEDVKARRGHNTVSRPQSALCSLQHIIRMTYYKGEVGS